MQQVLGLPGVLPVMNKKAVEYAIKVGLALDCKIAKHTKWDRKSYYYPGSAEELSDQPVRSAAVLRMGISISVLKDGDDQAGADSPGASGRGCGQIDARCAGRICDRSQHRRSESRGNAAAGDRDRAGPERRRKQVAAFGQELQKLVQFLGVSRGQMQMGHMRFEPNINVHITDAEGEVHKTAITEIKNLNSFSVLERATAYEVQRQIRRSGKKPAAWAARARMDGTRPSGDDLLAARQGRGQRLPLFPRPGSGAGRSGRCSG